MSPRPFWGRVHGGGRHRCPDQTEPATIFRAVVSTIGLVSATLLIGGLVKQRTNRSVGSRLILVGSLSSLLTVIALNPAGFIAIAVIATGLWTGNLAFNARPAEIDTDHLTSRGLSVGGTRWYWWLITAAALAGVGFLAVLTAELVNVSDGFAGVVLFFVWLLSLAAAVPAAAIGATLGAKRFLVRHRMRSA